jgi:hypothetical protein
MSQKEEPQSERGLQAVPNLKALAAEINAEHAAVREALQVGLSRGIRAGELLLQVKEQVGHGGWLPWLTENCPAISERTAQAYMRVARLYPELASKTATPVADLSFREAVKLLAEPAAARTPEAEAKGPDFIPAPGRVVFGKDGCREAWIVPDSAHKDHFYVTVIHGANGEWIVDGLKKPVRRDGIESCLGVLQFAPENAEWVEFSGEAADRNRWLSDPPEDSHATAAEQISNALHTLTNARVLDTLRLVDSMGNSNREDVLPQLHQARQFCVELMAEAANRKQKG